MKRLSQIFPGFILSTSLILSSCGGGDVGKGKTSFNVNAVLSETRNLTVDEMNIATRICYAYQSKSQKFRSTEFYGTQFIFAGKSTDCQNVVTNYDITSVLKYNEQNVLVYVPVQSFSPNLQFIKKVQTESSGYLAQLCPKVFTNQPVSNTTTQQNVKVQISFFREDSDGFFLQYFNKQADSSYKIESAEKFKVPTDPNAANGVIRGMDQYYAIQRVCNSGDKNKFSEFQQTFTSR